MHALIMSFGTRGDIQPYAALAGALARKGHDVTLAVPDGFADLVPAGGPRPALSHCPRCSAGARAARDRRDRVGRHHPRSVRDR